MVPRILEVAGLFFLESKGEFIIKGVPLGRQSGVSSQRQSQRAGDGRTRTSPRTNGPDVLIQPCL